ncbi:hypothetical protein [uncultured Ezakiella sp.]|uniref:hypothetical protein n=1 Tax=uncultured Ezakiella sp. TaxID=1637529 RepID=UPI0025D90AE9|nr:hypothetical protein [uncultured Ezakiella sp.]
MKKVLAILLACALLFTACNTNKMADEFKRLPKDERLVLELSTEDQLKLVSEIIKEAERVATASKESEYYKEGKVDDRFIEMVDGALQGVKEDKQNPKKILDGLTDGMRPSSTVQDFKDTFTISNHGAYDTRKFSELSFEELNSYYNAVMNTLIEKLSKDQEEIDKLDKTLRQELTNKDYKDLPVCEAVVKISEKLQAQAANLKEK